jgi:hypothetical protein
MNPFAEADSEFFGGIMGEPGKDDVFEFAALHRDGRADTRIGVTMKIDPPGRDSVNDFAAVGGVKKYSFGVSDAQIWRIEELVGEGMPDAEG